MPLWLQVTATVIFALLAIFAALIAVAGIVARDEDDARDRPGLHWTAVGVCVAVALVLTLAIVAVWS